VEFLLVILLSASTLFFFECEPLVELLNFVVCKLGVLTLIVERELLLTAKSSSEFEFSNPSILLSCRSLTVSVCSLSDGLERPNRVLVHIFVNVRHCSKPLVGLPPFVSAFFP